MARNSTSSSDMTGKIVELIMALFVLSIVLNALMTPFYSQWSSVNVTAVGGDASTQTLWESVPNLVLIIIVVIAIIAVIVILRNEVRKLSGSSR